MFDWDLKTPLWIISEVYLGRYQTSMIERKLRTAINFLQRNAEFRILHKRLIVGFFDHKVQNTKFRIVLKWSFFLWLRKRNL